MNSGTKKTIYKPKPAKRSVALDPVCSRQYFCLSFMHTYTRSTMKYFLLFFSALLLTNFTCQKDEETPTGAQPPASLQLQGKWTLVKADVQLTFSDGSTQSVSVPTDGNDYLEIKFVKKDGGEESGTIKNVYMGDTSTGDWVYFDADKSLDITYTSTSPHIFAFRTVSHVDAKSLVLTAGSDKVLQQYKLNGLEDWGSKKLTGGSVREEWKR